MKDPIRTSGCGCSSYPDTTVFHSLQMPLNFQNALYDRLSRSSHLHRSLSPAVAKQYAIHQNDQLVRESCRLEANDLLRCVRKYRRGMVGLQQCEEKMEKLRKCTRFYADRS